MLSFLILLGSSSSLPTLTKVRYVKNCVTDDILHSQGIVDRMDYSRVQNFHVLLDFRNIFEWLL